jgi:predicted outer membrane repeat protein
VFTNNSAYIGGAIYYAQSSATITECVFNDNSTTGASAGAVRIRESSLIITDCTFEGNFSRTAGGAINCTHGSELTLINCILAGNSVSNVPYGRDGYGPFGGALTTTASSTTIANCLFAANFAVEGGALTTRENRTTITNCIFAGNFAVKGGALFAFASDISINNCTFSGNRALEGNAIYTDYWAGNEHSTIHTRDSIVWDGEDSIANADGSTLQITFTDIPGVWPGYGNIDADPCFVDPGYWDPNGTPLDADDDSWVNGDYHLKSQAGRWDPNTRSWVADNITSPCIDTADPNTPLGPEPFPNGGRINMGAYGGTSEASKSYFGKPLCETIVAGDINGDCIVNSLDFSLMSAHWLGQYRKTYPGLATDPYPPNGQENTPNNIVLTWVSGSNALSHDTYLGTDYTAVRNAQKSSPEYKGNQPATTFYAAELPEETPHYWRIDEVGPHGETTTGCIWHFATGTGGSPR